MKVLCTATPAYGHILPMAPLMAAATAAGHPVALLTSQGIRADIVGELPDAVDFLTAGPMPTAFVADVVRRTGLDVVHTTPEAIGEVFGGSRIDLGADEAIAVATAWEPDVVVAEAYDQIGPMVAAAQGIPWHQFNIGPGAPAVITDAIARVAAPRHRAAGLAPTAALSCVDPCPSPLQDPEWTSRYPVQPMRNQAHRRPRDAAFDLAPFADPDRPTVLVTLGTLFSDPDTLAATVAAVACPEVNTIAAIGGSMFAEPGNAPVAGPSTVHGGQVRHVPFVPLAQLLDRSDLVVGCGGAGTVLGALAHGLPMVLWPLSAEQPINAARATAAGVAVTVGSAAEIGPAVKQVLTDDGYRGAARRAAQENAGRPSAADVLRRITDG